jgi:hypothetical protein
MWRSRNVPSALPGRSWTVGLPIRRANPALPLGHSRTSATLALQVVHPRWYQARRQPAQLFRDCLDSKIARGFGEWAVGARKRRKRRRRREALVHGHLEHVSRDLLEGHPDVVRNFIGRNAGIYALYRKNRLYYVGLATALRGRLKGARQEQAWTVLGSFLDLFDREGSTSTRN